MNARKTALAAAILLALFVVGCAGSDSEQIAEGPPGVVQIFYNHLNAGEYEAAYTLYSTEATGIVPPPGEATVLEQWATAETREQTLKRVVILESTETENSATISFEVQFMTGEPVTRSVTVVLEEGAWKLGLIA